MRTVRVWLAGIKSPADAAEVRYAGMSWYAAGELHGTKCIEVRSLYLLQKERIFCLVLSIFKPLCVKNDFRPVEGILEWSLSLQSHAVLILMWLWSCFSNPRLCRTEQMLSVELCWCSKTLLSCFCQHLSNFCEWCDWKRVQDCCLLCSSTWCPVVCYCSGGGSL